MDEPKRYIVWWALLEQGKWEYDIFPSRAAAVKLAEMKAEAHPGTTVRLFEEVARVRAEVKPKIVWTDVPLPEPPKQEGKRTPANDVPKPNPLIPHELLANIPERDPKAELYPVGCSKRQRAEGKLKESESLWPCQVCRLGPCMGAVYTP
jgi:hypothetical protein